MTRFCVNCGSGADTIQHLLPKAITSPVDYVKIPLCRFCHNYGPTSGDAVAQRLVNNIDNIGKVQIVTVNGTNVTAVAGSIAPGQTVMLPSGTFQASFVNKNTGANNDFVLMKQSAGIAASGNSLEQEYVGFVFLVTHAQR